MNFYSIKFREFAESANFYLITKQLVHHVHRVKGSLGNVYFVFVVYVHNPYLFLLNFSFTTNSYWTFHHQH